MHYFFDDFPEFVDADNRTQRQHNPITSRSLHWKCRMLLPPELIAGASVLDLGCCIGAMGQWSLFHNAQQYTGVEIQKIYVNKARKLLSKWGNKANIKEIGIRDFLNKEKYKSHDVVVLAGVLQTFLDPQEIIRQACQIARKSVVIEVSLPIVERRDIINCNLPIMQFSNAACNSAATNGQTRGYAGILSTAALELLFNINGFSIERVALKPEVHNDTCAYTMNLATEKKPLRSFFRFHYNALKHNDIPILENKINNTTKETESWCDAEINRKFSRREYQPEIKPWEFNSEVADNFDHIANKHIISYEKVINLCIDTVKTAGFGHEARIIDVGCATGQTLKKFQQEGYSNLVGVDNSPAMLEKVNLEKVELIQSDNFPATSGPFAVIIANWTLHFIGDRKTYLNHMVESLEANGIIIITDKMFSSTLTTELYHQFKRSQGVTQKEIEMKAKQIQGVLTPFSLKWYYNYFDALGGHQVDVISADLGFVTLLVTKTTNTSGE